MRDTLPVTPLAQKSAMELETMGEGVRNSYRDVAAQYRRDDEVEITTQYYRHVSRKLASMSSEFGRPITVVEVGCGTGRYFHCLKNVQRLVGLDISAEMLELARQPVRQAEVSIGEIELRCENVHLASFPSGSFDFIYSLGMFGNGCPVTVEICDRFYDWLAPGGKLFFNAVSMETMELSKRIRRRIRAGIYPLLPGRFKRILDAREARAPFFGLTQKELTAIMRSSRFSDFSIVSQPCHSHLWQGVFHFECRAAKSPLAS